MKYILVALLSSLLFILSFPHTGSFTPLVFIAFIPLLYLRSIFQKNSKKSWYFLLLTFLSFLIWNIGTTWWVANASMSGGILAFSINSLLMTIVFGVWGYIHKKINSNFSYWLLIPIWLLFEFGHHRWDLSWPWLTLGNYFSVRTGWVQWYEWTGTLGGSAWVLLVNLLIFRLYHVYEIVAKRNQHIYTIIGVLLLPIVASQILLSFTNISSTKPPHLKAVILQPNIDPYKEKFSSDASNEAFADSLIQLANKHITAQTDLVIAPETALPLSFLEDRIYTFDFGRKLQAQVAQWPQANLLIGASTVKLFDRKQSVASTPIPGDNTWYESYNSAVLISKNNEAKYSHKSKLVPGVELIPFSEYLPFLSAIAIENGGSSGTLGKENAPKVLEFLKVHKKELKSNADTHASQKNILAPIICYESIYGDFVRQQVQKGAQLLCIITNDGWWGDTPGYKQHFSLARLRAIETRRWVLRSANTGTSGSIDPSGKVIKKTSYWTKAAFSQAIELRSNLTFYSTYGDWLAGLSLSWILYAFSIFLMNKARKMRNLEV